MNIKYLVFVVYSIEYRLKRICKSLYSVFIYVLHNVPTSLELGLYYFWIILDITHSGDVSLVKDVMEETKILGQDLTLPNCCQSFTLSGNRATSPAKRLPDVKT